MASGARGPMTDHDRENIEKRVSQVCETLFLTGLPGFEPGKCWSQSPVPYRLAIALNACRF